MHLKQHWEYDRGRQAVLRVGTAEEGELCFRHQSNARPTMQFHCPSIGKRLDLGGAHTHTINVVDYNVSHN